MTEKVVPFPEGPIAKPDKFNLADFKSKTATEVAIDTLQAALPIHSLAQAKDYVRLHPDEEHYWSDELCFVDVPIKGQKHSTLHLVTEELVASYLLAVRYGRLALATKPFNVFFLCLIPTRNLDNKYNASNLLGCEQAKTSWMKLVSKKADGEEGYNITQARDADAFTVPKWPTQTLDDLIDIAFAGCKINHDEHPGLLRLIGGKQKLG